MKDKIQIESDVHLAEFKVMDLDDINVRQLQAGKRGVKLFQNPFLSFCRLVYRSCQLADCRDFSIIAAIIFNDKVYDVSTSEKSKAFSQEFA